MSRIRIIVEGQSDARLLKRLLSPEVVQESEFIFAGGFHRVTSVARTHLAINPESVLVIADADSTELGKIDERLQMMHLLLAQAGAEDRFRIVLAKPELETVFFTDPKALSDWLGFEIPKDQLVRAEFVPKRTLTELLVQSHQPIKEPNTALVDGLPSEFVDAIRKHSLVREIDAAIENLLAVSA